LCGKEEKKTVRRLSGKEAVIRLHYDSYNATEEQLNNCQLATKSQNNTDENPKCQVYFRISYKSIKCGFDLLGALEGIRFG
jgi:hypothetical protein